MILYLYWSNQCILHVFYITCMIWYWCPCKCILLLYLSCIFTRLNWKMLNIFHIPHLLYRIEAFQKMNLNNTFETCNIPHSTGFNWVGMLLATSCRQIRHEQITEHAKLSYALAFKLKLLYRVSTITKQFLFLLHYRYLHLI